MEVTNNKTQTLSLADIEADDKSRRLFQDKRCQFGKIFEAGYLKGMELSLKDEYRFWPEYIRCAHKAGVAAVREAGYGNGLTDSDIIDAAFEVPLNQQPVSSHQFAEQIA